MTVSAGLFATGYTLNSASTGFSGYTPFYFNFVAGNATERLSFTSTTDSAYGPVLDDVSIAPVPEPASWALMIGGFGIAGAAMRRRRARVAFA